VSKALEEEVIGLTPELLERLRRIAKATKRSVRAVLCDAVQEYWVRFACRNRLKQEEW
jgi:predicted transcriptional regulator